MCWKKLCEWLGCTSGQEPEPTPDPTPTEGKKIALLFAINNYPGSANDLNGCLNDQADFANLLATKYPEFEVKRFQDSEVTVSRFKSELTKAIASLEDGDVLFVHYSGHGTQVYDINGDESDGYDEALYLYDGPLTDDEMGAILAQIQGKPEVFIAFDSCFSGTATRLKSGVRATPKFVQLPNHPIRHNSRRRFANNKAISSYVYFSGCAENEYSYDAYFNGRYNGAFSYYTVKTHEPEYTYREWFGQLRQNLPNGQYPQTPQLEGDSGQFDDNIF